MNYCKKSVLDEFYKKIMYEDDKIRQQHPIEANRRKANQSNTEYMNNLTY